MVRLTERPGLVDSPELPSSCEGSRRGLIRNGLVRPEPRGSTLARSPVVFAQDDPNSLGSVIRSARHVASVVQDLISLDMWRVVNMLGESTPGSDTRPPADVLDLLNRTVIALAAFGGLAAESMTRGKGGGFWTLAGLERSLLIIRLLQATLVNPAAHEGPVLDAVLEIVDSGMTYRRRYLSSLRAEAVLDLVVEDRNQPAASLATQLAALVDDVDHLPRSAAGRSPEQRFALAALGSVRAWPNRSGWRLWRATPPGAARPSRRRQQVAPDSVRCDYPAVSPATFQASRHLATPDVTLRTGAIRATVW